MARGGGAGRLAPGHVTLADINERAVAPRENLTLNGIENAEALADGYAPVGDRQFDVIALNPPVRAGLSVVHRLIEGAAERLAPGGRFYLVGRTQQGVIRLGKKMAEVFGGVEEVAKGGGYRLYVARRGGE
jgi:16S rRNA (guanine1207-N2)-methyltransferase